MEDTVVVGHLSRAKLSFRHWAFPPWRRHIFANNYCANRNINELQFSTFRYYSELTLQKNFLAMIGKCWMTKQRSPRIVPLIYVFCVALREITADWFYQLLHSKTTILVDPIWGTHRSCLHLFHLSESIFWVHKNQHDLVIRFLPLSKWYISFIGYCFPFLIYCPYHSSLSNPTIGMGRMFLSPFNGIR